jgi:hypothetical protein
MYLEAEKYFGSSAVHVPVLHSTLAGFEAATDPSLTGMGLRDHLTNVQAKELEWGAD